jgi:hypothetical protein
MDAFYDERKWLFCVCPYEQLMLHYPVALLSCTAYTLFFPPAAIQQSCKASGSTTCQAAVQQACLQL